MFAPGCMLFTMKKKMWWANDVADPVLLAANDS